jgi:putative transposase
MVLFFAGTRKRPRRRKRGEDEGFLVVGERGRQWAVRRLNRRHGEVRVPQAGWARFRPAEGP